MTHPFKHYAFEQLRSYDDEPAFFALMGRFFASANVRRDCGGYPLSDGPRYLWFIVRRRASNRVLGFISIELMSGEVRIRDGYVRPEARQLGLFRALRQRVLEYIDALNQPCVLRVPRDCAALLQPYGFQVHLTRGNWATLKRNTHATRSEPDEPGPAPVQRTAEPAAARADRSHQPDPPMPA
ncbi:N-acetyltransferase [Achromobacter xylosoxidans]|uniref:N-acetyltransferase n=1 Tax=Alcaligenes xylosoxydans xylosoxydans TaxID=85698 RepID=UPI0022B916E6|nr:N-acetyltransferase [Achromobacter xylosoxidans]MCZ8392160.1 N-acetyltransferase [Achromobacter xylosoxidans]